MKDIATDTDGDLLWKISNIPAFKKYSETQLVTNGSFAANSDWNATSDFGSPSYIGSGHAVIEFAFWQSITIGANNKFTLDFIASNIPSGKSFKVAIINGSSVVYTGTGLSGYANTIWASDGSDNKEYTFDIDISHGSIITVLFRRNSFNFGWFLDDVSIKTYEVISSESDIDWVDSAFSNMVDLLDAAPNEYKQYPFIGLNAKKYRNAPIVIQDVQRDLRLQLQLDNWDTKSATAKINNDGLLEIDINAKIV